MTARRSLAWRVTGACLVVALVAVALAALVALQLVSTTARQVARQALAEQADVVAAQGGDIGRVVAVLQAQDITVVPLDRARPPGPIGTAVTRTGADRALTGVPVSAAADVAGRVYLVEARPLPSGGIALVRPVDTGPLGALRRNVGLALLVGAAAAVLVGVAVGTLSGRPLRAVTDAARRLRGGERDVRVPVRGPAEVAGVASAVNELADALAHSEERQRRFLLSVSHELRTPLTAVRGFGESIADGVVTGDDAREAGATVVREAERLEGLVADLIELARLEADDFTLDIAEIDLAALVAEAAGVWEMRARSSGVVVRREIPSGPVPVRADPRRLRQVIDALASNALRVTPSGAPLVLAVRDGSVQVRDGGPGLTEEDYAVVFEPGALHDRYRGRRPLGVGGIGLALVQGLVTQMGGRVEAGPAPEGGTAFTVTPAAAAPSGPGRAPAPGPTSGPP
ncbi:HAMP domain-containing sensor histidine kinase [Pseudonocardia endophytica]|uniref:histidine kinase n=1 Tax=Pseudonocardia endophytica TaxID=401976 RepID=A0A4R1HMS3_PSEEN|nr:HAMP domain-containing sensor histidine kinase [Pseudonocardia endophytica]TCK22461.1 signal transduction histidine kinase [Pseudonocardia endophytica]